MSEPERRVGGAGMTIDDLRDSDVTISPLMALLLGVPLDSRRVQVPGVEIW
jgi:hypothetical protein